MRMMAHYPQFLENEVFDEPEARREHSRSPVPERAAASSRDVLVFQSQTQSVHLLDALRAIPQTICPCRYVTTLPVFRIRESETPGDDQAQASIAVRSRTKLIPFMVNHGLP